MSTGNWDKKFKRISISMGYKNKRNTIIPIPVIQAIILLHLVIQNSNIIGKLFPDACHKPKELSIKKKTSPGKTIINITRRQIINSSNK